MSRYSGKQYKGASRDVKKLKRAESEARFNNWVTTQEITSYDRLLVAIFGVEPFFKERELDQMKIKDLLDKPNSLKKQVAHHLDYDTMEYKELY